MPDDEKFHGFYRAKVVDNNDPQKFGRVLVWIPDLMPFVSDRGGIWARPANNPVGGRNIENGTENHYAGTAYIPRSGSWLWVFFEAGNPNRPYYFAALDLENAKTLPEIRVGSNSDKWVILKSTDGRTVMISDDPDDARVEITGKKRKLKEPPSGDTESVYPIDENQTTILLDERDTQQKILIRTYKGDFIHIDIDEQQLQAYFKSDIQIKTDGSLKILAAENIDLKSITGKINIQASSDDINIKSGGSVNEQSGSDFNIKSGSNSNNQASGNINVKAGGNINHDASKINDLGGAASPAGDAGNAADADPKGDRNT